MRFTYLTRSVDLLVNVLALFLFLLSAGSNAVARAGTMPPVQAERTPA